MITIISSITTVVFLLSVVQWWCAALISQLSRRAFSSKFIRTTTSARNWLLQSASRVNWLQNLAHSSGVAGDAVN